MKIVIDAMSMNSPGGLAQLKEITFFIGQQRRQGDEAVIITDQPDLLPGENRGVDVYPAPEFQKGSWINQWQWYSKGLPTLLKKIQPDVVYAVNGLVPRKLYKRYAVMATVNNMLPFSRRHVYQYPFFSKRYARLVLQKQMLIKSIRMANAVVLYGYHCLDELAVYEPKLKEKSFVALYGIPEGIKLNPDDLPPHPNGGVPYHLYFSQIYPYKNHIRLLHAYRQALDQEPDLPELILAGLPCDAAHVQKIIRTIGKLGLVEKVRYIGAVDKKNIPSWLYHAEVNYFASLCETNSFVVIEILGVGGVLACSRPKSHLDAEGEACEPFDPYSVEDIKGVIVKLHRGPGRRRELRHLAKERAMTFQWGKCGKAIWEAAYLAKKRFTQQST